MKSNLLKNFWRRLLTLVAVEQRGLSKYIIYH